MFESTDKQESTAPAVNQQKERPAHWFKPGQSGNPKGRDKGSKNKFSKVYIQAWSDSFDKYGEEMIEKVRKQSPEVWLKIASQLVPKDLDVRHSGNVSVQVVNYGEDDEYQPVNVAQGKGKKLNGDTAALRG